jgi:hypothetical protein
MLPAMIWLVWKTGLKAVFHFDLIVLKRSVFLCILSTQVELLFFKQRNMLQEVETRL